jgi:membrane associated rhomboid family serine protease
MTFKIIIFINIILYLLGLYDNSPYYLLALMDSQSVGYYSYQWITYQFIHYDLLHFFFNMVYLFFFGISLSEVLKNNFGLLYLFSGVFGAFIDKIFNNTFMLMGSSASIFGVMSFFLLHTDRKLIKILLLIIFLFELVYSIIGVEDNISHFSHIGGIAGGFIFYSLYRLTKTESESNFKNN